METGHHVVFPQFLPSPLQELSSMLLYGHLGLTAEHTEIHFVTLLLYSVELDPTISFFAEVWVGSVSFRKQVLVLN